MLRKLVIFSVFAGTSAALPVVYQSNPHLARDLLAHAVGAPAEEEGVAAYEVSSPQRVAGTGARVVVPPDPRGHFIAEFKFNGRRVPAMIDTGATRVVMNRSTARSIGLTLATSDFRYEISTANGTARGAVVTIPSMEIGRIRVKAVDGLVLEDSALSQTLVGVSFLKRLGRYEVADGTLLMTQ